MATPEQLRSIMPQLTAERAKLFAPFLAAACKRFGIDSVLREAAFLAQLAHESGEFRWMKEIWGPNKWQLKYEGSASLGNTRSGDGKKFMGRGPIQITGRSNYTACSKGLGLGSQLLERPELLEGPEYGCLAAGWFWNSRNINAPADKGDFHRVTQLINGRRELGYDERLVYYKRALSVLGASQNMPDSEDARGPACKVVVDGEDLTKDLDPFISDGRVVVRVRPFAELVDYKIVEATGDTITVSDLTGNQQKLPFTNLDGIGYVAIRDLPTGLITWDGATQTATITLPS